MADGGDVSGDEDSLTSFINGMAKHFFTFFSLLDGSFFISL